eukprot:184702_1
MPVSIQHLMSLIIYCDFTDLCTEFSATFRPNRNNEPIESIKKRNAAFWWMSKFLREIVQLFGDNRYDEKGPFYTGMSFVMYIYQFNIRLCGPNSASKFDNIAIRFAGRNGMLIQLNVNGDLYNSKKQKSKETETIKTQQNGNDYFNFIIHYDNKQIQSPFPLDLKE